MDSTPDSPIPAAAPTSLVGLRVAAAVGFAVALVVVVAAFLVTWWVGVMALALVPVLPMGFVLGLESIRS